MRAFAELSARLGDASGPERKESALREYFAMAPTADAAWALRLLLGSVPKRTVAPAVLASWARELEGVPAWLFDESRRAVGDLAETVAHLLPRPDHPSETTLATWMEERHLPLAKLDEAARKDAIVAGWRQLGPRERTLWNRLLVGTFRSRCDGATVRRVLAEKAGIDVGVLAQRLEAGIPERPTAAWFESLLAASADREVGDAPAPFHLGVAIACNPSQLGEPEAWAAEPLWPGLRSQLLRRAGDARIWTRRDEAFAECFPELEDAAARLPPGIALDGQILIWTGGRAAFTADLKQRWERKGPPRDLFEAAPATFLAFDLLAESGVDWRSRPWIQRRARLEELLATPGPGLALGPVTAFSQWEELTA
ncbi:MAG TPA: ATP-dependent DNA ligase, partial [Planctomycetia bacterium]|nr:ATP-dependent DNA ligase [Planctomycetia bacterium]